MTAGTEITRNASKMARGLVSVQSRYNQIVDESSSTGQKLLDFYNKYGIAVYDQNGQLRKFYDVATDVAEIWDTLSKNEQSYYLNIQAGANQTQNLAAILSNFDTALEATATAYDSAGSAAKENERYMESLEAKVNNLKAAFQELIFGDGGLHDIISFILDTATAIVKFVDNIDGTTIAIVGLTLGMYKLVKAMIALQVTMKATSASSWLSLLFGVKSLSQLKDYFALVAQQIGMTASAMGALGWVTATFAVSAAFLAFINWLDKAPERKVNKLKKELEDTQKTYDANADEIEGLEKKQQELIKNGKDLNEEEKNRLQYLKDQNAELDKQLNGQKGLKRETLQATISNTRSATGSQSVLSDLGYGAHNYAGMAMGQNPTMRQSGRQNLEDNLNYLNELKKALDGTTKGTEEYYKAQEKYLNAFDEQKSHIEDIIGQYEDMIFAGEKLDQSDWELYNTLRATANGFIQSGGSINVFQGSLKSVGRYIDGTISLIDLLGDSVVKEGDNYYFVSEAAKESAIATLQIEKAKTEALKTEVQKRIDEYGRENQAAFDAAVTSGAIARMYAAEGATGFDEELKKFEDAIKRIQGMGVRTSSSTDYGDPSTGTNKESEALKKLKEEFDDIIDVMEHKLELDKRNGASISDQIKGYKDLQAEVHRQAEEYRKMGLDDNHEYIRALQKQWWDYQDDIDDLRKEEYEKQKEYNENLIDALKMYADEQKDALDDQIDALQEQLDLLDEQNDERERALELEEAEQALLDAQKQKIRVYREGVGWVYEADPRKVQEAEDKLQEIKDKNAQEDEKKAIEDKIQALKDEQDAWDKAYDEYKKYNDKMELELKLNKSIEEALLDQKLDNWEDYKNALKKIADDIIGQQKAINAIENGDRSGSGATSGSGSTSSVPVGGYVKTQAEADSIRAEMAANSAAWHSASDSEKERLHQRNLELGARLSATYSSSTGTWSFANGTKGMPETHLAMVGERGAELGIFPKGTGIVPHNLTENLMEIGKYSMSQLGKIFGNKSEGNIDKSSHINIQKVEVISNNANNFVKQLQNFVPISK